MPERPLQPPAAPDRHRGSWLSVFFAGFLFVVVITLLIILPLGFLGWSMVLGGIVLTLVIGFHYFIWGRRLQRILEQEAGREE